MSKALLRSESLQNIGHRWQKGVTPPGAKPWVKGQSGNPGGIGGNYVKAQSIYRENWPKAAQVMCELLNDPDPRVRGFAADKVMERAWGKPKDYDPRQEERAGVAIDPSQFTPEQRALIMQALRVLVEAQPMPVDGPGMGQAWPANLIAERIDR